MSSIIREQERSGRRDGHHSKPIPTIDVDDMDHCAAAEKVCIGTSTDVVVAMLRQCGNVPVTRHPPRSAFQRVGSAVNIQPCVRRPGGNSNGPGVIRTVYTLP